MKGDLDSMTISRKTTFMSVGILALTLFFSGAFYSTSTRRIGQKEEDIIAHLQENDRKTADFQIVSLGENIANYLTQIEDEIDRTMRNAGLLLQARALESDLTDGDLKKMAEATGMNDLYLAGMDGVFYRSTEKASIGISIFSIWDGYRMIVEGKAQELPSPIKVKVETGEIFKFTALPLLDKQGAISGILETALNASSSIEKMMQSQLSQNTQLDAVTVIEASGRVLTSNVSDGKQTPFVVGQIVTDPEILGVAQTEKPLLKWSDDNSRVVFYKPVKRFGGTAYILSLQIDPTLYVQSTQFVKTQFTDLKNVYSASTLIAVSLSFALILLVVVVYLFFIRRTLLRPVKTLSQILENIAEGDGDLTERIEIHSQDEIGAMAQEFNLFIEKIKSIVVEAKNAAAAVDSDSAKTQEDLDEAYKGIKGISESVRHVSANIAAQTRDTDDCERISAALSRDIDYLSDQISKAVQATESIVRNKESGEEKVSFLVGKNEQGIERNSKTARNIETLSRQITEVNRIVENIKAVAKQTQLLSLNASIEAARAGEHGQGFAVVAGEVKDLAEQSARSAHEIEKILDAVNRSSAESVEAVSELVKLAEEQNTFVAEVANVFTEITKEIDEMRSTLANVNNAVMTVDRSKEEMRENVQSLHRMGADNGQSAETISRAMASQVTVLESVRELSSRTGATITQLDGTLQRFKVE